MPTAQEIADLAAELAPLAGAAIQKLWLPSPRACFLELRQPGRTLLVALDAEHGALYAASSRPPSPVPALALQAVLRRALEGTRLARVSAPAPSVARLDVLGPDGPRALVAELSRPGNLALLGGGDRVLALATNDRAGRLARGEPYAPPPGDAAVPSRAPDPALPLSRALDARLGLRGAADALAELRRRTGEPLRTLAKKLHRTLEKIEDDAARAAEAEAWKRRGELLTGQLDRVVRGAKAARVRDWWAEGAPELDVEVDPKLGPRENLARCFAKYKKLSGAGPKVAARRAQVEARLAAAEALAARAAAATNADELEAVDVEARRAGLRRELAERAHEPRGERRPFRTFTSSRGRRILVGRGAEENDALTFRLAASRDLWLHARGLAGAHVVVPQSDGPADGDTVLEAAMLALHFSSARDADVAEVAATEKKHVRKPRGAAPGAVTYSQEKTLLVRREPARLEALLASEA